MVPHHVHHFPKRQFSAAIILSTFSEKILLHFCKQDSLQLFHTENSFNHHKISNTEYKLTYRELFQ